MDFYMSATRRTRVGHEYERGSGLGASQLRHSRSMAAVFTPLRSGSLVDEISDRIVAAVESGLLVPGQRLPNEAEFAAALGVSVVTIRESLARLRSANIIVTTRGRTGGSFISQDVRMSTKRAYHRLAELTRVEINEYGLHYQALAVGVARLAARRASRTDIGELGMFLRADTDEPGDWRIIEAEFVLEVAAVARSARLARELLRLQAEMGTVPLLPNCDPAYRERSAGLRADVVRAIASGDPAAADTAMDTLVTAATERLLVEHAARS